MESVPDTPLTETHAPLPNGSSVMRGTYRIKTQGKRMFAGQATYFPMKVNSAKVGENSGMRMKPIPSAR